MRLAWATEKIELLLIGVGNTLGGTGLENQCDLSLFIFIYSLFQFVKY